MELSIISKWHHINDMMPKKNEFVLVETRFCKYPFITAYFNGVNWINCDDKTVLMNTRYWAEIKAPFFYCQSEIEDRNKCSNQCEHCSEYFKPIE